MSTTALGVSPDSDGNGVTPRVHRKIIGAQWQSPGIITGLQVSGRTNLSYTVSEGVAVCEKNSSDGRTLAYWQGGTTPTVQAGDPTYARIDVVWITANNKPEYNDSDNSVHVGVTSGTPSANPVEPAVPDGAVKLMAMLLPAGATSTQNATRRDSYKYAIPYAGNLGRLGENWWKQDLRGDSTIKRYFYEMPITFTVPTRRQIELRLQACLSANGGPNDRTEWAVCFQMDGHDLDHSGANFVSYQSWETHETSYVTTVEAGTHTARLRTWLQYGVAPWFHYYGNSAGDTNNEDLWIGRRFQIFDKGAVA